MFNLPTYVSELRLDVRELRIDNARLTRSILKHRQKSGSLKGENDKLREENNRLRKENSLLKEEIEKLTKTNSRYQVALFDHGNFKSKDESGKKPRGGQIGHIDTNREAQDDYSSYERKRLFLVHCANCGRKVKRVDATRNRILIDVVINPGILKYILSSERQWCTNCKSEVNAKHSQSLPFTEYGINTFMIILVLRFRCHTSLLTISKLFTAFFGLTISKSEVANILFQAKEYLKGKYDELLKEIREGNVIYNDETGWLVHGQSAWMWIAANNETTVYFAAESRGGGIAKDLYGSSNAYSMHDGLLSYTVIPKEKNLFCWSHVLRFAYEETILSPPDSDAVKLRDELVSIFHLKKDNPNRSKEKLKQELEKLMEDLCNSKSEETSFLKIQQRARDQKDGLIMALLVTPDGTNNLAERELRPIVINRKISFGSDTFRGMETQAILSSVVRTAERRTNESELFPTLKDWLIQGVKEQYPNYAHL